MKLIVPGTFNPGKYHRYNSNNKTGWRIKIRICLGVPTVTHAGSGISTWPKRLLRFLQAEIRK